MTRPSTGYQGGNLNTPSGVAIDGSGNVWVSNLNSTTVGSLSVSVSEFVGSAVPVVTPLVAALQQGQVGVAPGSPIPVQINSTALPYYTLNVSYSAQLYASGRNSGTYTWSLASGTLPTGLTLSSTGLITGTTAAAGSSSITVQAADSVNSSNIATATLNLTAGSSLPVGGNESELSGKYAIRGDGFRNGSSLATVYGVSFVGSLTFDGSGGVAGEVDFNGTGSNGGGNGTVTGHYTLEADNRGTMILVSSLTGASPIELAFSVGNFNGGVAQSMRLIEYDDTNVSSNGKSGSVGAGEGKLQSSGAFVAGTLGQSFVFGLAGETSCTNYNSINTSCTVLSNPFGPLSAAGKFTGDGAGSVTFGEEDVAGPNITYNSIGLSGSYTNPDSSGRGTLILTPSGTLYPNAPSHYVYYLVGSGEMFLLSTDAHSTYAMLSGDALVQQTASFSSSTLSGTYIVYESAASGGDGLTQFPNASSVFLGQVTVLTRSQISLVQDSKDGSSGQLQLEKNQSAQAYSIDSNGRLTLTGGGGGSPVFYLANGSQSFGTEQPSSTNQGNAGLLVLTQQSGSSFSCTTSSGNFMVGSVRTPMSMSVDSGIASEASGVVSVTADESRQGGVLTLGGTDTLNCSADSLTPTTGRFELADTHGRISVGYTISPNNSSVLLDITPGEPHPSLTLVQK